MAGCYHWIGTTSGCGDHCRWCSLYWWITFTDSFSQFYTSCGVISLNRLWEILYLIDTLASGRNTFVSWLSFKMRVFNLEKIWCMYIYYICEQRWQHTSTLTQVVVAHSGRCCNCSISDQSESWFSSRFSNRRPTGRETSPGRLQKKMGPNLVSTMYQNWLQPSLDDYLVMIIIESWFTQKLFFLTTNC